MGPLESRVVERRLLRSIVLTVVVLVGMPTVAPQGTQATSRFRITLPKDDAELLIEGKTIADTGTSREVRWPPLESGRTFVFTFTARWRPNGYTVITRNKRVEFKAGDDVAVDLSRGDPNDRATIRYVPTPGDVVAAMIELAGIKEDDVVFEPGTGDGRIVIAAVRAGAKEGVGIDIDPDRVAEARANVREAKLEHTIDIRLGDALDVKDLSRASVVFLYMGEEFDLLMRPLLWKQLKVGARVVSHQFTMGDWKPDKTVYVSDYVDDAYQLHLWTITEEIKKNVR
jgi:uncharacterized protein (TIGR03000 family)